jgi:hypothetical protein
MTSSVAVLTFFLVSFALFPEASLARRLAATVVTGILVFAIGLSERITTRRKGK